jgi:hypothetical protein
LSGFTLPATAVENVRWHYWSLDYQSRAETTNQSAFSSLLFDREARERGMKLFAADQIEILSGERERRAREFLRNVTGQDFSRQSQWYEFLSDLRQKTPWYISRANADRLVAYIRLGPPFHVSLDGLREETGVNLAAIDDYLAWLEDPRNTRNEDWQTAYDLVADLPQDIDPLRNARDAMQALKRLTGQSFESPQQWIQWWSANKSNLVLSPEGNQLVGR